MKLYYVDALAGCGKTSSAIKYAIKQAKLGAKIAFVQPSTDLIDQTYANLLDADYRDVIVDKFHNQCLGGQVKVHVTNHLNDSPPGKGEIILMTHQTFMSLPYWHNAQDWNIIIDEIPQIHTEWVRKLDVNFATLIDNIELGDVVDGKYAVMTTKQGHEAIIQRMAACQYDDEQDKLYQDIAVRLSNPDMWESVIHLESLKAIVNKTSLGRNTIQTYSIVKPETFAKYKTVTIMGAMFTKSVLFMMYAPTVEFVEHATIAAGLYSTEHTNGNLLTIKYLYEENWSKTFREQMVGNRSIFKNAKAMAEHLMSNKQFIYASNNSDNGMKTGIRLSNICHGINEYSSVHNAVFLSALNSNGPSFSFMKTQGISPQALTEAQFFQTLYQFIMRTSLRNPNNKAFKTVVVMDRRSAEYLAGYFPGCKIEAVDGMQSPEKKKVGRKTLGEKPLTPSERVARARAKKKAEQAATSMSDLTK